MWVPQKLLLEMFAENLKQATSFTFHHALPSNGNHTKSPEPAHDKPHPLLTKRQSWKHCIPHEMIFLDYNKSVKMLSPPRIIGREAKRLSVTLRGSDQLDSLREIHLV